MPYSDLLLYTNPRRHHRRRKNPFNAKAQAAKLLQGATVMDAAVATAGLAAAFMVPNLIIKGTAGAAPTSTEKWERLGISAATAIGVGFLAKMATPSNAKSAAIGGAAGVLAQALANLTTFPRIQPSMPSLGAIRTPVAMAPADQLSRAGIAYGTTSEDFGSVRLD